MSWSDVLFCFQHPYFTCPIGRASNITRPKSRPSIKKFVHSCLADFTQLGTNLDPILNYSNIYMEWKKDMKQGCVKFEQVLPQIGDFFVDCKHSWPFVNEHYL